MMENYIEDFLSNLYLLCGKSIVLCWIRQVLKLYLCSCNGLFDQAKSLPSQKNRSLIVIPEYNEAMWSAESRIVNDDGLLNLFHGTYADFNSFDDKKIASNEAHDQEHRGLGHFLSSLPGSARLYGSNGYLYSVHLYSVNPKTIHFNDRNDFLKWNVSRVNYFQEEMRVGGYDSIKAVCGKASDVWYIAPFAQQIQIIKKERIYLYENRRETLFEM